MLKLNLSGNMDKFYDLMENRFLFLLAEKKLHHVVPFLKIQFNKSALVENIGNTIFFFEKSSEKASMLIRCAEKKVSGKIEVYSYGLAIIKKSTDEFDLYIDSFSEAINKGIIQKSVINTNLIKVLVAILLSLSLIAVFTLLNVFAIMLIMAIYPVYYFIQKKRFKRKQKIMNKIVSIFEGEFNTLKKTDTNDWVSFWGRVKSGAEEVVFYAFTFI